MRTTTTILLAASLAFGMIATPAAAEAGDDDPTVDCTLELPPSADDCEIQT